VQGPRYFLGDLLPRRPSSPQPSDSCYGSNRNLASFSWSTPNLCSHSEPCATCLYLAGHLYGLVRTRQPSALYCCTLACRCFHVTLARCNTHNLASTHLPPFMYLGAAFHGYSAIYSPCRALPCLQIFCSVRQPLNPSNSSSGTFTYSRHSSASPRRYFAHITLPPHHGSVDYVHFCACRSFPISIHLFYTMLNSNNSFCICFCNNV